MPLLQRRCAGGAAVRLFVIDIGVPRNADPAIDKLDDVYRYDIDELASVAIRNAEERGREQARAEAIVAEEQQRFDGWFAALRAVPTIRDLRARVEAIRARELERALRASRLDEAQREAVEALTRALVNKILHEPLSRLRARGRARGRHGLPRDRAPALRARRGEPPADARTPTAIRTPADPTDERVKRCASRRAAASSRCGRRAHVAARLERALGCETEIVVVETSGDRLRDVSLARLGGKGLFVKEIEEALLDGRADVAVHSAKDLPAALAAGRSRWWRSPSAPTRATRWSRASAARRSRRCAPGARVGTGSVRRAAQLRGRAPDLEIVPLRGNVPTRLRKLASEGLDAVVLACAGLERLGARRADRRAHRAGADAAGGRAGRAGGRGARAAMRWRAAARARSRRATRRAHRRRARGARAARRRLQRAAGGAAPSSRRGGTLRAARR